MLIDRNFEGVVVALMTAFDDEGGLDIERLGELVDHLSKTALRGLFVAGTSGEGPKLNLDEKKSVIRATIDRANGRVPVFAGSCGVDTRANIDVAMYAQDVGADAIVLLPPYYYHPSQGALFEHYSSIASRVELPIFLYNVPNFAGYSLDVGLVGNIVEEWSNVVGIKDSSGNMGYLMDLIDTVRGRACVFQGLEPFILCSLVMGARGAVVSDANVAPGLILSVVDAFKRGSLAEAEYYQFKLARLDRALSTDDFIRSTKEAMRLLGMPIGTCRKPCAPVTIEESASIKEMLDELDIPPVRAVEVS